jgi:short-subunit dehydrogenase
MRWLAPALGLSAAVVGREVLRRARQTALHGQVALITGSSRGFGLALARELARRGCRIVLSARDEQELERARQDVARFGVEVIAITCDIGLRDQVQHLVAQATAHFGRIDILINNAGIIVVGPLENQTLQDFERAMQIMFWGTLYPTLEVLPGMRARRGGHIVNITSIGGKVSVPHLLPYAAAKFAAVGLSEGLHAELARDGVHVLTVVPGLMRTGSHLNAQFKGHNRQEFLWFSLGASLPFTSIAAEDAARQVVGALRRGDAEVILSWQANLVARVHGLAPGLTTQAFGVVNRLLPAPGGIGAQTAAGHASRSPITDSLLEALGERAARLFNQVDD